MVLEELGALHKEQAQLQEEVVEHSKEAQASEATVRSTEAAIATYSAELEADTAAYAKLKHQTDRDLERKRRGSSRSSGTSYSVCCARPRMRVVATTTRNARVRRWRT